MILTKKGVSFSYDPHRKNECPLHIFSQIPVDESCMSDYNSIIKSINALKH